MMIARGKFASHWPRPAQTRGQRRAALSSLALCALTGCGLSDGAGALFVDPSRYALYRCEDLATRRQVLTTRENELRGLIEKASESAAVAVRGSQWSR